MINKYENIITERRPTNSCRDVEFSGLSRVEGPFTGAFARGRAYACGRVGGGVPVCVLFVCMRVCESLG